MQLLIVGALAIGTILFGSIGCDNNDNSSSPSLTANENGLVVNQMNSVMGSIATLSLMSDGIEISGGVPTSYCNENGAPIVGGTPLDDSDEEYPSAIGFCQATYNSQSPDTARGVMYIAGGIMCAASYAGLFDNLATGGTNSQTIDITFSTVCWGSQAEVDALIADAGAGFDDVPTSVEEVSATTAFNYKITYTIPGDGAAIIYIKNENGVKAALNSSATGPWYIMMNEANGTLIYEGIDTDNERRLRLHLDGTIQDTVFSTLDSINGIFLQSSGAWATFASYTGNPSAGLKGNLLSNGGTDQSDECYWPGATATCGTLVSIPIATGDAVALDGAFTTAASNLAAATSTLADFATVDPTDTDITQ